MKALKLISLILFLNLTSQEDIEKSFVIIKSTKDYSEALTVAKEASKKLNLKLDLRGYYENKESGLETDIECGCGESHGYIPRGRMDDGDYVSIEYSNPYKGFEKGYYMVITSSYEKNHPKITEVIKNSKELYEDVYTKTTTVYMGCMH